MNDFLSDFVYVHRHRLLFEVFFIDRWNTDDAAKKKMPQIIRIKTSQRSRGKMDLQIKT